MKARIIDPLVMELWSFDATLNESADDEWDVTQFPVETGLDITDHIQAKPCKMTLEGILTDTPLDDPLSMPVGRSKRAYEALVALARRKQSLVVVCGFRLFQNMVITAISLKRAPGDGDSLSPSVTLQEVRYVTSMSVPIPPEILSPPISATAQSPVDGGTQAAGAPTDEVENASQKTLAKSLVDNMSGGGDLMSVLSGG